MHARRITVATLGLAMLVASACGTATATVRRSAAPVDRVTATARAAPIDRVTATARAAPIDRVTATARAAYRNQVSGAHSIDVLHRVGADRTLLRLLAARNLGGVRAYVARQYHDVWYHWHVSRLRIRQGSKLVTENGVRFVMPASQMVLHGPGGRAVGTLQVSMQDEIGFVRLMHRRYPVQVVIRGRGPSHLRASMRAAGVAKLPARGRVSLGGSRYVVRSFHEQAWDGEPVTIWLLMKA